MKEIVPPEIIEQKIYLIRGEKVMLDADLAHLYGVTTKRLNEQVKRNADKFPEDFAFQLTAEEYGVLSNRSQIATGSQKHRDPRFMEMEKKYDAQFKVVFDAIRQLMSPPETKKRKIGFRRENDA